MCVYTVLECVCVQCSSVCVQYPYSTRVCVCTHNCVYTRSLHQAIRYVTSTVTIRMCLQLCVHTCTNYMYYVLALTLMHHAWLHALHVTLSGYSCKHGCKSLKVRDTSRSTTGSRRPYPHCVYTHTGMVPYRCMFMILAGGTVPVPVLVLEYR